MATQTDYDRMLAGLQDCRWRQMRVIADAADDAGDQQLATGWRWLADNRRWACEGGVPDEGLTYYLWNRSAGPAEDALPPPIWRLARRQLGRT